jgi:xanthine dehydrogenase accessory factor
MNSWARQLAELEETGTPCVLATLCRAGGSVPAPVGARLLLAMDGRQWGTVGGGALEATVLEHARSLMGRGGSEWLHLPLAEQGQCCGGLAELLLESFGGGSVLHVLGAGHVGQELVRVLEGTRLRIRLVDPREEWIRRPGMPTDVQTHAVDALSYVDGLGGDHGSELLLILSHSHELDLELLRRLAGQSWGWIGLIGSRNKWRSFRTSLEREGVDPRWLDGVVCPVGDSRTGKAPREVAIALAREALLAEARLRPEPEPVCAGGGA